MLSNTLMTIAAIIGALTVIFGGVVATYKIARRLDDAIGKDDSGKTVSDRLAKVEHQLWENGGSSLADRVNRIETTGQHTATEVSMIKEILLNMVAAPAPKRRRAGGAGTPVFGLSTFNTDDE